MVIKQSIQKNNQSLIKIIFIIPFLLLTFYPSYSQFGKGISFSAGLNTMTILGNNPGNKPFFERDTTKPPLFGGGFAGVQPGIEFMIYFPVQDSERFVIPIGLIYSYLDSRVRRPLEDNLLEKDEHTLNSLTLIFGLNYTLKRYPIANAKFYLGLEGRITILQNDYFTITDIYSGQYDTTDIYRNSYKSNAVRFGTNLKLGLEGQLAPKVFVNMCAGLGILNLLGKDNSRGELFTWTKQGPGYIENSESTVYTYNFSFVIQYKL